MRTIPSAADADKLAKAVTAKELTDGTVVAWLNGSDHSYHNWIQGENGPVISDKPVAYALAVSGDYKTTYTIGDELDLTGLVLTATWTDGSTTEVDLADVEITGFDTNQRGEQTVTLAYGAAKVTITVTVLLPAGKDITVSFALLATPPTATAATSTRWLTTTSKRGSTPRRSRSATTPPCWM